MISLGCSLGGPREIASHFFQLARRTILDSLSLKQTCSRVARAGYGLVLPATRAGRGKTGGFARDLGYPGASGLRAEHDVVI